MGKRLFSIIIPTYNRAILLKRCLDSIVGQTVSDWEAIVVDNFSEDNTEEVIESYGDSRIKYVKNHNYGVIAVSRNKALDMAEGEYICFLDSDDAWLPNKLESILPHIEQYDLVYHNYIKSLNNNPINYSETSDFYEIRVPSVGYVIQRGDPINPSCACVKRSVIGDIRFDESKELFAVEDYDFFLQLLDRGITIKKLNEAYTLYDMSGCSHNEKASERDLTLFNKWKDKLTYKEQKEFYYLNSYRRACYLMRVYQYKEAQTLYFNACKSHINENRIKAIRGLLRSSLYRLIKIIIK